METIDWRQPRSKLWTRLLLAAIPLLAAAILGACIQQSWGWDLRAGRGDLRLAIRIATDPNAPEEIRRQALGSMHGDVRDALETMRHLEGDPDVGDHATNFLRTATAGR